MPKLTKAQQKRLVRDIQNKTQKLFIAHTDGRRWKQIANSSDMVAVERLCAKWMKRIG